jgi:protein TonB
MQSGKESQCLWISVGIASHDYLRRFNFSDFDSSLKTEDMEPLDILYADNLDLLFENRNKLYGAYPLRKYYKRRLGAAMASVTGMVFILSGAVIFFRTAGGISSAVFNPPDTHLTNVDIQPPPIKEPVLPRPPAVARRAATAILTNLEIVRDRPVITEMATLDKLRNLAIDIHANDGPADIGIPDEHQNLSGNSVAGNKDSIKGKTEIFERTQTMPEFPGGPEALKRFLIRNLRMPDAGLETGTQVRVIAKFVVGPDGRVGGINIIQSGGTPFDEEVRRVIARMPDWKPGLQHQKKVSVYFYLPVNFVIPSEN